MAPEQCAIQSYRTEHLHGDNLPPTLPLYASMLFSFFSFCGSLNVTLAVKLWTYNLSVLRFHYRCFGPPRVSPRGHKAARGGIGPWLL